MGFLPRADSYEASVQKMGQIGSMLDWRQNGTWLRNTASDSGHRESADTLIL